MEGDIFEICWHKMNRKALEFSTMVGENFEICWPKMTRKGLGFSTMVGEIFEIFLKYAGIK